MRCPGLHPLVCWHHWAHGGQHLARAQAPVLLVGQFCTLTFPVTLDPWVCGRTLPKGLLSSFCCTVCLSLGDWETYICWGNISSLGPFVSERCHVNSELWGTSTALLYRFLCCCLTASHLFFFILFTIREASHRAQLRHRQRSLGEEARLISLSSSLLPHAHGWQSSLHRGILAPGSFCLRATLLCSEPRVWFGLAKSCFLSDVLLSQTVFLFQQRVLCVSWC